jgi:DNA mismatch repair protein MutS2
LPAALIERAEARVPEQERAVTALLAELERRETQLTARESVLQSDESSTQEHGRRVAEREQAVRGREREVEKQARAEARRYLLEARAEVERAITSVRASSEADRAERERGARQTLEKRANEHAHVLASIESGGGSDSEAGAQGELAIGDIVDVDTLGGKPGRLVEMRGDSAVVAVGALKITAPLNTLRRSARALPKGEVPVPVFGELPEEHVKLEIDLRGVRVSEVDELLLSSLDAAVRADLKSLRIIHGKGTGALRDRVGEMLGKDVRVKSFRLGAWNEGGAGVTVAEFA